MIRRLTNSSPRLFLLAALAAPVVIAPEAAAESQLRRPAGISISQPDRTAAVQADHFGQDPEGRSAEIQSSAAEPRAIQPSSIRPSSIQLAASQEVTVRDASADDSLAVRLAPRDANRQQVATQDGLAGLVGGPLPTIIGALAVTLGVFAVFVALSRRAGGGAGIRILPREAFEVIGQTPIGPRQKLLVVRCGVQALVIGVSPAGIERVAQIDDPDEAGQLIASCRSLGSTVAFRNTLREMEKEPAASGFVDNAPQRAKRGNLFLRA